MKKLSKQQKQRIKRQPSAMLVRASNALVELVEGVGSVRWNYEGRRLKDTHEWAHFYVAVETLRDEVK